MSHRQTKYKVNTYYNDVQSASGNYFSSTHISNANTSLVGQWLNIGKIAIVKYTTGLAIQTRVYLIPTQYFINRRDPKYGVILASSYDPSSPGCVILNVKDTDSIYVYGSEFYRMTCGSSRLTHVNSGIDAILLSLVGNGSVYALNKEFVPGFSSSTIGGSLSPLLALDDAACKAKLKINDAGIIVNEEGESIPLSVECGNCPFSLNGEYLYGDKNTVLDPSTGSESYKYFSPRFWIGIINTMYVHTLLPPDTTDGKAALSRLALYLDSLRNVVKESLVAHEKGVTERLAYNKTEFDADVTYNANGITNPLDLTETGPVVVIGGIAALVKLGLSYPRLYYVSQGLFKAIEDSIASINQVINVLSPGETPEPPPDSTPADEDPQSYDDGTCIGCNTGPCTSWDPCLCNCGENEIDITDAVEEGEEGDMTAPTWYIENGVYNFGKVSIMNITEKREQECGDNYYFPAVDGGFTCYEGVCEGQCGYDLENEKYCQPKTIECATLEGGEEGPRQRLYSEGKLTSCAVEYNVNGNIFYVRR